MMFDTLPVTGTYGLCPNGKGRPTSSPLSFCVVIPMYNEELGAERCVRSVSDELGSAPCRTALIVVDDGSTDRTPEILHRLAGDYKKLIVLSHERNAGYGSALRTAARRAAADGFTYALFMDSDLTNDPKYIPMFVQKMLLGYDVIKASRYSKGGEVQGVPAHKVAISAIGNRIARFLFRLPISDCTNGFRALKVDLLTRMTTTEPGFPAIMEELYLAKSLSSSFCEIPFALTSRTNKQRPSSFAYRPRVFYRYLKYAVRSFFRIAPNTSLVKRSV